METILYCRNPIIETIDYGDLIQRPHIIYICTYIDPIGRPCTKILYIYKSFCKTKLIAKKTNMIAKRTNLIAKQRIRSKNPIYRYS